MLFRFWKKHSIGISRRNHRSGISSLHAITIDLAACKLKSAFQNGGARAMGLLEGDCESVTQLRDSFVIWPQYTFLRQMNTCYSRSMERRNDMFQHILVPLDGSSRAEQALPVAARLARVSGGTMILLKVVNLTHEAVSYGIGEPFLPPQTIENDLTIAQDYLDQVLRRSDLAGIALEKQVITGNPAMIILSFAEEQSVDLIVMSSHGYTGFKRWLLGSVAEKVTSHASAPVLVLRESELLQTSEYLHETNSVRALVPLDASARTLDAITPATALVAALSTPGYGALHLTQIMSMPEKREQDVLLSDAKQKLDTIGQSIRDKFVANVGPEQHVALTWAISLDSDIAEGIVRIAENGEEAADTGKIERCNLIALTTHGSTGIVKWAVGSITERVLHATKLPLLIVRPADMLVPGRQQKKRQAQAVI
jgi:nucleotide-binding universal stress UspA family protein